MKKSILFAIVAVCLAFASCKQTWVQELESKNPLRNDTNFTSVYFRFDTIINDFEVSGILYPWYDDFQGWNGYENGVRLFFHSLKTGKEYVWTDWHEHCHCFQNTFMSKNVYDIYFTEGFDGFHNGDSYIFNYDTTPLKEPSNELYPNAEYQFYDVDFDGDLELLINYYHGGSYSCTCYEVFEITDTALVRKEPVNEPDVAWFSLDDNTVFDAENKTITLNFYSGCCERGEFFYRVDDEGDIHAVYSVHHYWNYKHDIDISDTTYCSDEPVFSFRLGDILDE